MPCVRDHDHHALPWPQHYELHVPVLPQPSSLDSPGPYAPGPRHDGGEPPVSLQHFFGVHSHR